MAMRNLIGIVLAAVSGVAAAKSPSTPTFPLPAGTPVEFVTSWQGTFAREHLNFISQQGTLTGLMIAKMMQNNEVRAAPVRAKLLPAKLDDYFHGLVLARLSEMAPQAKVVVVPEPWAAEQEYENTRETDGQFVVVKLWTGLSFNFETVGAYMDIWVWKVEKKSNGKFKETLLKQRRYTFQHTFPKEINESSDRMALRWNAMDPARIEAMIRDSMEQTAAMFSYEMTAEGQAEADTRIRGEWTRLLDRKYQGRVIRSDDKRFWLRPSMFLLRDIMGMSVVSAADIVEPPADAAISAPAAESAK
jgi:hypothetical protein